MRDLPSGTSGDCDHTTRIGLRASGVLLFAWADGRPIHSPPILRMAFNLKRVLQALLFSSNQPLSIKEIQAAFSRFHEQPAVPTPELAAQAPVGAGVEPAPAGETAEPGEGADPFESAVEPLEDAELYEDVPSLVTAAQIREAMDQIAAELRSGDSGLVLAEGAGGYRLATHPRFARWVRILRQEPPPLKLSQSAVETLAVVAYRQPVTRAEIESIRGVAAEAGIHKLMERDLISVIGRAELPGRPIQYGTTPQFLEFVGIRSLDELPASDVLTSRQISEWLRTSSGGHKPDDADMGLSSEELPLEAAPAAAPEGEAASHAT
jgi:segregation and condensation protein B